ncbi:MAG: ATP-binding cassette domain-containing protein [Actinobacteria bacterium]|nr:ATP-binding cassette domain-containing protein [Actinomycetota bacterium]MCB8996710.1 ATP-binding cassette domain-containing protein [Actinomycetota bacterium]MCB9415101.1 ATP-binding cassette domain-containing protein [Actinomycetota bacterium]
MIEVRDLAVRRGTRLVLEGATFTAHPGECLAIVGPNGSGKSSMISAIAGDLPVDRGQVRIHGRPVGDHREQSRLRAVMGQQTSVAFGFTVKEVVEMARAPWGDSGQAGAQRAVKEAVESADVGHLLDRDVQSLSGGELARVAFARTLAQGTQALLLDEPVAALDLAHQVKVFDALAARLREGHTALVVLHDLTLVSAVADRVVLLSQGRQVALGTPAEVITPELIEQVYGVATEVRTVGRAKATIPSAWC